MKNHISNRDHIKLLVDEFYKKVQADKLLGPVFSRVDWQHHLPVMYDFWSSMLLGDQTYRGNPLQKHLALSVGPEHFQRWLKHFHATVDEHFAGEKAEEVKSRAESIAGIFQSRMGLTGK